ncbi:MAG: tetratricopeptide repeat protein [Candidatus Micrarchaeota archaeon]|nr:tetratricopeptide repeat protein [Candidatus Micrarchaeota archaeon]
MLSGLYRRISGPLSGHLAAIGSLGEKPTLSRAEERALRASLRQVAMRVAYDLEHYHSRSNRRVYKNVDAAVSRFERTFGHPPGDVAVSRQGKARSAHTCIGVAQGIATVLGPYVSRKRLGVVRLDGPDQAHPSILLSAGNGQEYVVDNWGMDRRAGAYTLDEFRDALLKSVRNKRSPLFYLSDELGIRVWKNPKDALAHPQAMLCGGLKLLDASAHENLAWQHMEAGDDQKALAHANKAIRLFPLSNLAFMRRGDIHLNNGRLGRAMADYRRAVQMFPFNTLAHENMAIVHGLRGDRPSMLKLVNHLQTLVSGNVRSRMICRAFMQFLDEQRSDDQAAGLHPFKKGAFLAFDRFLDQHLSGGGVAQENARQSGKTN